MAKNPKSEIRNPKSAKLVPALLAWFSTNARDLPWRRTRDPYAIWVSEIMLQQTQVKTVIPFWERWLRELPTIQSLAKASPEKIHKLWEGLGYYTRVRNMQKAAQQIIATHDGKFPRDFAAVLALPGIGRYTAGAICSIAFNQPAPILDGNVIRVLTRLFGIAGDPREKKTNAQLWQLAGQLVVHATSFPPRAQSLTPRASFLNQSLMELGALICTPRNPQCEICPVKKLCVAFREQRVTELPNLGKRAAATQRRFAAFIVERGGKFLARQRPSGVVNAHLWEFPNEEIDSPNASAQFRVQGNGKPFCTVRHSITRYRITLEAFHAKLSEGQVTRVPNQKKSGTHVTHPSEAWHSLHELEQLAFTAAHRKILEHLRAAPQTRTT